jgi:hypothetical protein
VWVRNVGCRRTPTAINEHLEQFETDKQTAESQIDGVRQHTEQLAERVTVPTKRPKQFVPTLGVRSHGR